MKSRSLWLAPLAATLLAACAPAAAPTPVTPAPPPAASSAASSAAAPESLTANSPRTTAAGTAFTAPAGWLLTLDGPRRVLDAPEKDLRVVLVDAPDATADAAVASAWASVDASFSRAVDLAEDRPGRAGWDARRSYEYKSSPNEHVVVLANAFRHGNAWTVLLATGSQAELERRGAQVRLVVDSLRPAGFVRESFAGRTPHAMDEKRLAALTQFLEKVRSVADVPGLAVGLVQGGKVVYARGLGVRELGKKAPPDADTLFMIGSNSKALTTLLLAKEVDEKRFTWDTPVTNVYPAFKLGDAATTSSVKMRHLVCACTGIPRQDLEMEFEYKHATAKSELDFLASVQPTTKFGEVFQYNNTMAAAAGYIGAYAIDPKRELGASYDEAMKTKVFGPLGMTSTTFDSARAFRGNHAAAHTENADDTVVDVGLGVNDMVYPSRPAGGVWSNLHDMLRYVQMELTKGVLPDGKRYIAEDALLTRRAPQVSIGADATYGMGLVVDHAWGVPMVHHGGAVDGFRADMFWFPDADLGGVILANSDTGDMLLRPIERRVAELLFDGNPEAEEDATSTVAREKQEMKTWRERLTVPADAAAVAKLAPHYVNASLGNLFVRSTAAGVLFDVDDWKSAVATRKNDDGTTSFVCTLPSVLGIELVAGEKNGKRTLTTSDEQHEYVFVESP
jgi:CubicO group peptidase (beta-lactamase class C family)